MRFVIVELSKEARCRFEFWNSDLYWRASIHLTFRWFKQTFCVICFLPEFIR